MDNTNVKDIEATATDENSSEDSEDEDLPGGLDSCALDFAEPILTGSWAKGTLEDRQQFREDFANYVQAANTLRSKFDVQVWDRHAKGLDNAKDLPSIRAPRTGDKPGRRAKPKTVADVLLKR